MTGGLKQSSYSQDVTGGLDRLTYSIDMTGGLEQLGCNQYHDSNSAR